MTRSPAWYRALARLPIKNVFSARSAQVHRNDTAGPPVEERVKAPRFAHVESARPTLARRVASVVTDIELLNGEIFASSRMSACSVILPSSARTRRREKIGCGCRRRQMTVRDEDCGGGE